MGKTGPYGGHFQSPVTHASFSNTWFRGANLTRASFSRQHFAPPAHCQGRNERGRWTARGTVPGRTEPEQLQSRGSGVPQSAEDPAGSVWEEVAAELSRLACALGIGPDRAEDVLQDVYLTALRKPPPTSDRAGLRRWLFRVTVNRCNLEHRKLARWRRVFRGLVRRQTPSGHRGNPSEAVEAREEQELVRRALDRLKTPLRTVLVLRYFAELDSKEIGDILEMPDSTVRTHLRTARRQLALELKRAGYPDD